MMKAFIIVLFTICSVSAACTKKTEPAIYTYIPPTKPVTPVTPTNPTTTDTLTYLALGDSYTIGQSVTQQESFPYQLIPLLAGGLSGHTLAEPFIIARTGWTADNLIDAINYSSIKDKTYSYVTLLIGVNDQYQGLSQDNYRTKFVQLLNTAIKFAGGNRNHVFVLSIPDYGVTPYAQGNDATIGPLIDQFNSINREESTNASVNYVDITDISKLAAADLSLIANDGLHPSGKMYGMWMKRLAPVVMGVFKK